MPLDITERSAASDVKEIINQIISEEDLPLSRAKVELTDSKGNQPDIVVFDRFENPLCAIEAKRPYVSTYQVELFDQAFGYANTEGIDYFATLNFNSLVLWKTFEQNVPLTDRRFKEYSCATIDSLQEFDNEASRRLIKEGLRDFLSDIVQLSEVTPEQEEEILPSLKFDQIFINYLHSLVDSMTIPLKQSIVSDATHNPEFQKELREWFAKQGWTFTDFEDMAERVARQYTLIMVNKIMFYDLIKAEYPEFRPENPKVHGLPEELPDLEIPEDIEDGGILDSYLQGYFDKILKIDYKTVYQHEFFDEIEIPPELVAPIRTLVNEFDKYDFAALDYEVLGNIFESLIPEKDRHKLGQYFTRSDVVDLITAFSVDEDDDAVIDPACGAGTFLIRTYSRLKYLEPEKSHRKMLKQIWGVDIAEFPAHLTTINLVSRDLSERANFPRVARSDFFDVMPSSPINDSYFVTEGLDEEERKRKVPDFDALVANPPYTRHEEMEDMISGDYKAEIQDLIQKEIGMKVGKKCSIYTHFFFHGGGFLAPDGRMGQITSNSWLDADYGKYLQQYLLENFKIKAIIESQAERFFADADVNTCITLLEKCENEEERSENTVRFVQFRKQLPDILEVFADDGSDYEGWDDSTRWDATDRLINWIFEQNEFVMDPDRGMRVYTIAQEELFQNGVDEESGKYKGAKWGRYTRAPDVFFTKVLDRDDSILTQMTDLAEITEGQPTGANSFFYLREDDIDRWDVEDEYLKPSLKSPKDSNKIRFRKSDLKTSKLVVPESANISGTNVREYIRWGEEQGYKKDYFSDPWYSRDAKVVPLAVARGIWKQHMTFYNSYDDVVASDRFAEITPDSGEENDNLVLCAFLNSTLGNLIIELSGRTNLGMGALDVQPTDIRKIPVIDPDELDDQSEYIEGLEGIYVRELGDVFEELGADTPDQFSQDDVPEDRRELDEKVFDTLGFSQQERIEVYESLISLVRTRQEKASSAGSSSSALPQANINQIVDIAWQSVDETYIDELDEAGLLELDGEVQTISAEGQTDVQVDLSGTPLLLIGDEEFECDSVDEARYLRYMMRLGRQDITVPSDEELNQIVKQFEELNSEINSVVENVIELTVSDESMKEEATQKVKSGLWERISDQLFATGED